MRTSNLKAIRAYEVAMKARNLVPATVEKNLAHARRFLVAADRPTRKVKRLDVEIYLASMAAVGIAASTQARLLCSIRGMFRAGVELGLVDHDPTEGITVKRDTPPHLLLSVQAVQRLMIAASDHPGDRDPGTGHRDRALLELLYALGLRASEAVDLAVTDLDMSAGLVSVQRLKGGPRSVLALPPSALEHVVRYIEAVRPKLARGQDRGRLLLTRLGKPLDNGTVGLIVKKIGTRAGRRVHPHAFRRAIATHLVEAGVPVPTVAAFLGHRSLGATQVYIETSRIRSRRAVSILDTRPESNLADS